MTKEEERVALEIAKALQALPTEDHLPMLIGIVVGIMRLQGLDDSEISAEFFLEGCRIAEHQ
jgi:hypothetical protein